MFLVKLNNLSRIMRLISATAEIREISICIFSPTCYTLIPEKKKNNPHSQEGFQVFILMGKK